MPNLKNDLINDTLSVDLDSTQTLSNKTLTTPIINGPTITATGQTPVIHGIYLPEPHVIYFEGSTADGFETILTVVDPTADRTVSLPDASGTLALVNSDVTFSNLTVSGDLTVSGNTTTLNTANLNVEDNFILLNSGESGSPTLNSGIEVERGTSTNVFLRWNESTDKWEITNDGSTYNNIATTADLSAQTTTSITANTEITIASFNKDVANAAEFTVKVEQGSRFLSNKVLVLHNGTTADFTKYGELSIAAAETVEGTWTTRTSNFGSTQIQTVAYGNSLWVAAGYAGELRTSTDAITWTTRTSNFPGSYTGNIYSVAYGNNLWVAGGYGGRIRTSTDAITWTTRTSNFTGIIQSIAYGNNLWVAGGRYGEIRTSTDAITWTTRTSNFGNTTIQSVAYGNNLWVAVGGVSPGQIRTSTDAITWVTRTTNFGSGYYINSVAFGNNLWVAAGTIGQIRTSTDGITWTTRTSNFGNSSIQAVAYGNNLWVAAGTSAATSTDGTTWTTKTSNFSNTQIETVAYGNNLFVAAGHTAEMRTFTYFTESVEIPLTLSADISGSDVRLRATITDAATTTATAKVLKTLVEE